MTVENTVGQPDWTRVAIGAALLMLAYFTLVNHVEMYPLNNLPEAGRQWPSTLAGWIQFSIFIGLMATRRVLLVLTSLVISVVWFVLQLLQWWVPYLSGGDGSWFVEGGYEETVRILPSIQGHAVTPDLQHNLLQLLSLVVIAAAVAAFLQVRSRSRASRLESGHAST